MLDCLGICAGGGCAVPVACCNGDVIVEGVGAGLPVPKSIGGGAGCSVGKTVFGLDVAPALNSAAS